MSMPSLLPLSTLMVQEELKNSHVLRMPCLILDNLPVSGISYPSTICPFLILRYHNVGLESVSIQIQLPKPLRHACFLDIIEGYKSYALFMNWPANMIPFNEMKSLFVSVLLTEEYCSYTL